MIVGLALYTGGVVLMQLKWFRTGPNSVGGARTKARKALKIIQFTLHFRSAVSIVVNTGIKLMD